MRLRELALLGLALATPARALAESKDDGITAAIALPEYAGQTAEVLVWATGPRATAAVAGEVRLDNSRPIALKRGETFRRGVIRLAYEDPKRVGTTELVQVELRDGGGSLMLSCTGKRAYDARVNALALACTHPKEAFALSMDRSGIDYPRTRSKEPLGHADVPFSFFGGDVGKVASVTVTRTGEAGEVAKAPVTIGAPVAQWSLPGLTFDSDPINRTFRVRVALLDGKGEPIGGPLDTNLRAACSHPWTNVVVALMAPTTERAGSSGLTNWTGGCCLGDILIDGVPIDYD